MKLLILLLFISCSTLNKSKLYSGAAGAVIGGLVGSVAGKELSPNSESDNFNQNLGLSLGAASGALIGSHLGAKSFKEDPENFKGDPIEIEYKNKKKDNLVPLNQTEIQLSDLGIKIEATTPEVYQVKTTPEVPAKYKDDVYKQLVIKHKIPEKRIRLKNGKTYILKETELIEHKFIQ